MEISILFNHIGLSYLFALFVFFASFLTALQAKKVKAQVKANEIEREKEKAREREKQRLMSEAVLNTFSAPNSDEYFKYHQAQEVAKKALEKASIAGD